jgi:pimeloyl-ACP methyl ester carboxylesterase
LIVKQRIDSRHLAGNLLGDPSERDLYVYLPPSCKGTEQRYATAYLLLGYGLQPKDMVEPGDGELGGAGPMHSIADVLDLQFFREPSMEMIVAVVDGWTKYGGSQYVDSPVNGNFESFAVEEVVSYVDAHFPTIPRAESRAVFGYSSGGFGAWHLGSRHPDVFGAMAMLSADSYFELSHLSLLYKYFNSLYPDGRDPGDVAPGGPVEGNIWSQLSYGLSASYSPNSNNPPYFVDFPVEFLTGKLIPEIWSKWLSYDPVVNCSERVDNLRLLRGVLLEAGRRDDWYFHWGHRILSASLTDAGIDHDFREHRGTHEGRFYEAHIDAVQWLATVLRLKE